MNHTKYRELLDDVQDVLGERKRELTVQEFARLTNRHPRTVWAWCAAGELPATQRRKGGPYSINYRQLIDFFPTLGATA